MESNSIIQLMFSHYAVNLWGHILKVQLHMHLTIYIILIGLNPDLVGYFLILKI